MLRGRSSISRMLAATITTRRLCATQGDILFHLLPETSCVGHLRSTFPRASTSPRLKQYSGADVLQCREGYAQHPRRHREEGRVLRRSREEAAYSAEPPVLSI